MDEEAGISSLPEHILQHILSFLPLQEEAVRTCVLSKSWRHLGSTRPKFSLKESYFGKDKEKFMSVLEKSLQVYSNQKLCIEYFSVTMSKVDPELALLLENWIPKVIHDIGVKKLHLSFVSEESACFVLPSAVFECEPLKKLYLKRCDLSQININYISIGKHLKTLNLRHVTNIQEETLAKILSSCPLIEGLFLWDCEGNFKTINMHNHHNLKIFELAMVDYRSIKIYLPNTVERIGFISCPNWFRYGNHFPGLTSLYLEKVPLSKKWFDSFSRNFPCLLELRLVHCKGVDEFKLSSRSIEYLEIAMTKSTKKATIDAPSIKWFSYSAYISQSISFATTTTSSEWNLLMHLYELDLDDPQLFLKLSGLFAALSRSQEKYLLISDFHNVNHEHIEHLFDISVCCSPVAIEGLDFSLNGVYYDSFFSDLMNGLFRIIRPRVIKPFWYENEQQGPEVKRNEAFHEFLCKTLQLGRLEDEGMSFWQHDLEEVSLEVKNGHLKEWHPVQDQRMSLWQQFREEVSLEVLNDSGSEEWHPVQGTINWSEYVAALLQPLEYSSHEFRFRLKWRE